MQSGANDDSRSKGKKRESFGNVDAHANGILRSSTFNSVKSHETLTFTACLASTTHRASENISWKTTITRAFLSTLTRVHAQTQDIGI